MTRLILCIALLARLSLHAQELDFTGHIKLTQIREIGKGSTFSEWVYIQPSNLHFGSDPDPWELKKVVKKSITIDSSSFVFYPLWQIGYSDFTQTISSHITSSGTTFRTIYTSSDSLFTKEINRISNARIYKNHSHIPPVKKKKSSKSAIFKIY